MLIRVRVIPNAKRDEVIEKSTNFLKIKIAAPAIRNKANKKLVKFLAKYFNISKSQVKIKSGLKSRDKIVDIPKIT